MPESSKMEETIHHKMQEFALDPDPADWNAIYERLHGKRRRIIFWWILPLAGAILIGSGLYLRYGHNDGVNTVAASATSNQAAATSSKNSAPTSADPATPATSATAETAINDPAIVNAVPEKKISDNAVSKNTVSDNANPVGAGANAVAEGDKRNSGSLVAAPAKSHSENDRDDGATHSAYPGKSIHKNTSISTDKAFTPAVAKPEEHNTQPGLIAVMPADPSADPLVTNRSPEPVPLHYERVMPLADKLITAPKTAKAELNAPQQKTIPNLSTHKNKGWYLGAYAGAGINTPGSPISFTKAMDLNAGPSGGSSYNLTSTYMANGSHIDGGLVLQKKTTKFELSIGLGFQRNTWTQGYTIYQDSILPTGATFSRTDIASKETRYQHAAIELPIMAGFRLVQKGASGIWLNAGLNNAFSLHIKELQSTVSGTPPSSGGNLADPLTSAVNKYHPMLRLGLAYDHSNARSHWQLMPMLQYSLNNVVQRGDPDIRMLQLGLQFRYYFKALGH